ncbi:MAG: PQQ-dependent sugar dehydrogenase [Alphaproteobacteria bacterium]|nr:PQQ-dependent sugar dehydrogenase [Alphaproteobacteria bacterium]
MRRREFVVGVSAFGAAACGGGRPAAAHAQVGALHVETLAQGLRAPWGLAFLPTGAALMTEKRGGVRVWRDGMLSSALAGGPENVRAQGQSGLLDIAIDPQFAQNSLVYISFFERAGGAGRLALYRARFDGESLREGAVVFRADARSGTNHPGGRMLFLPDETLLLVVGVQDPDRDRALDVRSTLGKVLRLTRDGAAPADNPFADRPDALATLYTYGHRNAMGLARDSATGAIWLHENGPRGGDELNLLQPGANYGWPRVTYGREYSGAEITDVREAPGVTSPITQWTPSLAPSGLCVYGGAMVPDWRGDLFIGMLAGRRLQRLRIRDGAVIEQEDLLAEHGARLRDVREGPDGALYVLNDDAQDGELWRVSRA